jgi:hypothetical protein
MVSVRYSEYKEVEGVPIAHRREYCGPAGDVLAVDRFDKVQIFKTGENGGSRP